MVSLNGSAADAIVATTICLGTVNMFSSGLGGGGFALIKLPNQTYHALDFRESAPIHVLENSGTKPGNTVATPGELRGLWELHKRFGRAPWVQLVQPSIKLALNGFELSKDFYRCLDRTTLSHGSFMEDKVWMDELAPSSGEFLPRATIYRRYYAGTLKRIGLVGPDAMYNGTIGMSIVDTVQKQGGTLSMEDFRAYQPIWRKPVQKKYREAYDVVTTGVPTSGPVVLGALNILDDVAGFGDGTGQSILWFGEAVKQAYKLVS